MFRSFQLVLMLGAMCSAFSVIAADISVRTAKGEVTVSDAPQTIVVYDLLSLDTLDALGVQLKGKPAKTYVDYIDNFVENPVSIGASSEPNYEAVVKMNPDLFVIGGGSSKLMEPLSKIAPTIDMYVRGDDHVAQMLARLEDFGKLTNTEDKAALLKADFLSKLAKAKSIVHGKGNTLIVMTSGGKLSTFGANSRFGWLFTDVGLIEAAEGVDDKSHGESISFEFIAKTNPDNIVVLDRSAAIGRKSEGAEVTLDNALVKGTTAAKEDNIIYLTPGPAYVMGGGYQGMMSMLDDLIQGFGS
ncbi:siderophore ABC transporter substrate-binding protein [Vibrio sp. WJH972]